MPIHSFERTDSPGHASCQLFSGWKLNSVVQQHTGKFTKFRRYEYLWADGTKVKKPIRVSAPEYVDSLMSWIESQLNNEQIFPLQLGVFCKPCLRLLNPTLAVVVTVCRGGYLTQSKAHNMKCLKHQPTAGQDSFFLLVASTPSVGCCCGAKCAACSWSKRTYAQDFLLGVR